MNSAHNDVHSGLSRRSVLRAGAHAAWVVPVVTVATASPAMAHHSPGHTTPPATAPDLALTGFVPRRGTTAKATIGVANTGDAAAENVQVTISIPNSTGGNGAWNRGTLSVSGVSAGWTVSGPTTNGTTTTFTFTRDTALAGGTSETLSFYLTSTSNGSNTVNLTALATASNNVPDGDESTSAPLS